MELDEAKKQRLEAEEKILEAIRTFQTETGLQVTGIDLHKASFWGLPKPSIIGVHLDVEL